MQNTHLRISKIIMIGLFTMMTQYVQAQSLERPVQWGIFAGPEMTDYIYRGLTFPAQNPLQGGYTAGATASIGLRKHIGLQSGITYSFETDHLAYGTVLLDSSYYANGVPEPTTLVAKSRYHDLHIPLLIRWHFRDLQNGFYVGLGPEFGLTMWHRVREQAVISSGEIILEKVNSVKTLKPFPSLIFTMGYVGHLTERLRFTIEPYGRTSGLLVGNPSLYHINFGLRLGIAF